MKKKAEEKGKIRFDIRDERFRQILFWLLITASFFAILIYNVITPFMTDDLSYGKIVSQADSFLDLIKQEQAQYMNWTGRSVNHIILRSFMFFSGSKLFFNICNSIAFVALTLFMYFNIENKKKYDVFIYLLINLFVWTFSVSFAQTVLWQTGACNYLWGSTIILGYISLFRYCRREDYSGTSQIAPAIALFLTGIVAGWCNENTSGGCILLILCWIVLYVWEHKKVKIWMISGLAGNVIGFLFMVLAPGNAVRQQFMEEEHSGLFAIVSRWQKCNLAIRNHFFILLAVCIIVFVLVRLQQAEWKKSLNMLFFFIVFAATCYALVLTPEPVARAYFGAGIFLMISCIQGISDVSDKDLYIKAMKLSVTAIFTMSFLFTYIDSGANLMRIYRESNERMTYIEEQKAKGNMNITVPLLRPAFENKYSYAYDAELSEEDSGYWINVAYATYYEVNSVSAVPRDEWIP